MVVGIELTTNPTEWQRFFQSSKHRGQNSHTDVDISARDLGKLQFTQDIRIICPCNIYPLYPTFYIAKLGYAGDTPIFLIFALKHRLWVLVRTASPSRF